ncbi:MAG: 5-methylthioadenosine/S-adenosylhomocysteine deaminase [Nitrospirae bacterium]|nr:5-methylthioadenosine/S-adenosylhomocysteine deaminase [Nitrospirota bacterium]
MISVDHIIYGDYILPMDQSFSVIEKGAVAIQGNKILDLGSSEEISRKYNSEKISAGEGRVVLPGFINTHTHAAMVYFRGIADDLPLTEWLNDHIWPAENTWLSPSFISDAVELACLEMLKGGVTTYNDMYFFEDAAGESSKRIGMRAVLGSGILDFPSVSARSTAEYLDNAKQFVKNWQDDELITPCIAPHALYTCGPDTLKKSKTLAEILDVPLHIHLSETQWEVGEVIARYHKRPVEYLADLGFLDESVVAAHCIWLHDNEIDLLAKHKVGVSHCMESNLKLASGFAPVVSMLTAGIKISFGTDGAASNNDLSILSEMATTAKVHKALSNNPTVLDAKTALLMATRWGAEVLGLGHLIGSIERGKIADIIIINIDKPHLTPLYNIYSHIVYAAMASDVEAVMVNGNMVINDRRLMTVDEAEILYKAKKWCEKIRNR